MDFQNINYYFDVKIQVFKAIQYYYKFSLLEKVGFQMNCYLVVLFFVKLIHNYNLYY